MSKQKTSEAKPDPHRAPSRWRATATRLLVPAVLLMAALGLAACGSDSSSSSSSSSSDSGLSGEPIEVASIDAYTVPILGYQGNDYEASQARVDYINAHGGIDGRPVHMTVCDTRLDANKSVECAREVVENGAVAAIGLNNATKSVFDILEKGGIPIINNSVVVDPYGGETPVAFAQTSVQVLYAAASIPFKEAGIKKMSAILGQSGGSDTVAEQIKDVAERQGVEVVNVVEAPLGTTDFGPFVAKALEGGVEGVFVEYPGVLNPTVIKAVAQADPNVKLATLNVTMDEKAKNTLGPLLEGILVPAISRPSPDTQGMKELTADFKKYAPDQEITDVTVQQWARVWTLEQILKEIPSDEISSSSVLAKMEDLNEFEMDGLYPPLTTTKPGLAPNEPRVFNTSVVPAEFVDGQLVELDPDEPFVDVYPAEG